MAWSTPYTYAVGELLTASLMNTYQRDQFNAVLPYGTTTQTYTPQLTATTSNPDLGSGAVQAGRFYKIGRWVYVHVRIVFGTSGVGNGSGNFRVSVPLNGRAGLADDQRVGAGDVRDASTTTSWIVVPYFPGTTRDRVQMIHQGGGAVDDSNPFSWGFSSDEINLNLIYEAA